MHTLKKIAHIRTYSVKKRLSKVNKADFAAAPKAGRSFRGFFDSLPNILKAKDIRAIAKSVVEARKKKKAVIFMAGAHVIKCGLSPVLIELIKKKVITCICLNGAGIIHDFEIAFQGKTSEDVAQNLKDGSFGMGRETADFINNAINCGAQEGLGLGASVCRRICQERLPYKDLSLLYNAYTRGVPVYVFVAIGSDIIHQHQSFDGGLTGQASASDFCHFVGEVAHLNQGGVVLNFGSAVILPEVFLKALNLARNTAAPVKNFVTANFDMIHHYRPQANVVSRPTQAGGKGFYVIGHHELMLPLLAQAIIEKI